MRRPSLIFCDSFLLLACVLVLSSRICRGQNLLEQKELMQIAVFHDHRPQTEITKSWQNFLKSHPKADVNSSLSFLRQEMERGGTANTQLAGQQMPFGGDAAGCAYGRTELSANAGPETGRPTRGEVSQKDVCGYTQRRVRP
jgi:hypothetical protein